MDLDQAYYWSCFYARVDEICLVDSPPPPRIHEQYYPSFFSDILQNGAIDGVDWYNILSWILFYSPINLSG
jgi:hypothetical protein